METTENQSESTSLPGVRFADHAAASLLSAHIEQLCSPPQRQWQKIKENASRTVYRGQIDSQVIYLKHYHKRGLAARIGRCVGASDALSEFESHRHLSDESVPTPPVLAAMCAGGSEWLATKAVEPTQQASTWHEQQLKSGDGRGKIEHALIELAGMVGRMHAAGVLHRDLHCGNLLVKLDTPQPQLVLMDLHRIKRSSRLTRRQRAADLAQLYHDREEFTTRSQRLRFLKHYLAASCAEGTLRGWQDLVSEFGRQHRQSQYRKRDRRITGGNRYFSRIRLPGGWHGHVMLACKRPPQASTAGFGIYQLQEWRQALESPEKLLEGEGLQIVKDSASGIVIRRRITVGNRSLDVYVKRPRRKHRWKIVLDCFREPRAIRAFRLGHQLLNRGIATALPLAALQRRVGPLLTDSILIAEAVDAPHLDDFLNRWLAQPPHEGQPLPPNQRWQLAQQVLWQMGRMLQRLHDNNFAHRDLKGSNMLLHWSLGQSPQIVLVDLDGLRPVRKLTTRRRFQGLMRLNVSLLLCPPVNHAGRLRMLLGYLRRPGCGNINFKPYWRVLEEWSAKKLQQQIRSRRKKQKASRKDDEEAGGSQG